MTKSPINYYNLVLNILVNLLLIFICSDSGAAIPALAKTITEWGLVWEVKQVLEEVSGSNKITLVWIPSHHVILRNVEGDILVKEGTKVPSYQTAGIPLTVGKEVISSHTRQKHLNRRKACKGYCQSKMLTTESQPSFARGLQAMNGPKIKGGCGILTGLTTLKAPMLKLGLRQQQDCQMCVDIKEDCVHIVCHCPALACKRYGTLGHMFLKPKDLETTRVNGLISLVANTRLAILTTLAPFKTALRYNGTTKISVALRYIMEPLAFFYHFHHHHTTTTTTTTVIHFSSDFDTKPVLVMSRKMHCISLHW